VRSVNGEDSVGGKAVESRARAEDSGEQTEVAEVSEASVDVGKTDVVVGVAVLRVSDVVAVAVVAGVRVDKTEGGDDVLGDWERKRDKRQRRTAKACREFSCVVDKAQSKISETIEISSVW